MRICIISRTMFRHSAHHTPALARVARVLVALGHEVVALTTALAGGEGAVMEEDGCIVHYLGGTPARKRTEGFWAASAAAFDRMHAERPFDVVFGRGTSTWGFFTRSRFAAEVPVISHQGTYPRWMHQVETRGGATGRWLSPLLAPAFALSNRRMGECLRRSARVVCITPELAAAFRRAWWWDPPRTLWLAYGMDLAAFRPRPPETDPPRLVSVGRLTWDKGILPMIDMLARLRNRAAVLEVIGPGPDRTRDVLLARARARGVADRYRLCGPVPNPQVPDRLAGATAFVFPSTHAEGLGKVVIEAMAAGVPVVAYDLPVLRSIIRDGENGFVVPIRSVRALADRVDRLLADPALQARMAAAARATIERDFRTEAALDRWRRLLEEVTAEAAARRGG